MRKVSEPHPRARRKKIGGGARGAFAQHGYHGATVAKLEDEIGLSRGAIFNYYPDKWSLFLALVRRDRYRLYEVLEKEGLDGLLRLLTRESPEWRGVRIVGTDMSPQAVGRQFCDRFYVVPPGRDPGFVDAVLDIVRRENVDIVLPQSSSDLLALAEGRERFMASTVLVSPPDAVRTANDTAAAYALLDRL